MAVPYISFTLGFWSYLDQIDELMDIDLSTFSQKADTIQAELQDAVETYTREKEEWYELHSFDNQLFLKEVELCNIEKSRLVGDLKDEALKYKDMELYERMSVIK